MFIFLRYSGFIFNDRIHQLGVNGLLGGFVRYGNHKVGGCLFSALFLLDIMLAGGCVGVVEVPFPP